ncbi:hem-containing dehydratase protein [Lipomyces kononenkoae]|uniref:Hem-containing dehydratase protein n=1 Tax=Lipomyces kononenkoae TaxID=34357 RepID=A0ACC3T1A7_LIPKO
MSVPARLYPFRQPTNHKPPIPRWLVQFPEGVDRVFTAYIGIQQHTRIGTELVGSSFQPLEAIQQWLAEPKHAPDSVEQFQVLDGDDIANSIVFVCYWDNSEKYEGSMRQLNLAKLHAALNPEHRQSIGLWCERFTSHISRLETNYSGLDYLPGLARLHGTKTVEHTYSAYWGAARDRIPDSSHDLFAFDKSEVIPLSDSVPLTLGRHLAGTNYDNLVHIRSGQFWANCSEVEVKSYEEDLEPTLRIGLSYLWENPVETGSMGLRYLSNSPKHSSQRMTEARESCVTGFFRNLSDLEGWAKRHRSHLAIYTGAIKHAKKFGEGRKFRTWHEVSVLKRGEAHFEYVNCVARTGVLGRISLTPVEQLMQL